MLFPDVSSPTSCILQLDGFSSCGNDVETLCCQNTLQIVLVRVSSPVVSFCRVDMFVYVNSDFFLHQLEPAVKVFVFFFFVVYFVVTEMLPDARLMLSVFQSISPVQRLLRLCYKPIIFIPRICHSHTQKIKSHLN